MKVNLDLFLCLKCKEDIFPFQKLSDEQFFMTSEEGINKDVDLLNMTIFPNNLLKTYFKDINNINVNATDEETEEPAINCHYYDINLFNYKNKKDSFSLFHLNIASLSKNKDKLETILNMIDLKFDVVGITENLIKVGKPSIDVNINGYKYYSTPTDADKGGALIYINDQCNTKPLPNFDKIMYKPKQLESVFIEIVNKNKKNILIGCTYRHPSMDLTEFNDNFLNPLMEKVAAEDKILFLIGDFNIELLKVDMDTPTTNFFDTITSNLLVPHIIHPTRITANTRTVIDNIYCNSTNFEDGISGNVTLAISDHLAQFLIIQEEPYKISNTQNYFKRN